MDDQAAGPETAPLGDGHRWRPAQLMAVTGGAISALVLIAAAVLALRCGDSQRASGAVDLLNISTPHPRTEDESEVVGREGGPAAQAAPPAPRGGTRQSPWLFDLPTAVRFARASGGFGVVQEVWNVTVSAPFDDTQGALDRGAQSPPDGIIYAGFDVSMTLAEGPSPSGSVIENLEWGIFGGATAKVYRSPPDQWCGPFGFRADAVYPGYTFAGRLCIPISAQDLSHAATQVTLGYSGDVIVFGAVGVPGDPAPIEVGLPLEEAEQHITATYPFDTAATVAMTWPSDPRNGSVWEVMVSRPSGVAVSPYGPPRPVAVARVEVSARLIKADTEPQFTSSFVFGLLGGSSKRAYDSSEIPHEDSCVTAPGRFARRFGDSDGLLIGGEESGSVCIPAISADIGDPRTAVFMYNSKDSLIAFGG